MHRRLPLLGLKLLVSAGLIAWLWSRFDIPAALDAMTAMGTRFVAATYGVLLMHGVISAWRWRSIVHLQGGRLGWDEALRLFFIAMFFNQTLSTTVGGDAVRVWMLRAGGIAVGAGATGILLERVAGLLALIPLLIVGLMQLPETGRIAMLALLALAISLPAAILATAPFDKSETRWLAYIGRFAHTARHVLFSTGGLTVLGLSLTIHLEAGLAVWLLAQAGGAAPGLWVCLTMTPPVLLLATLPISFGGWGPREAGLVWLLGLFGVASAPALAVSVALGLLVMAAGLPGAVVWLISSRRARIPSTPPARTTTPLPPGAAPPAAAAPPEAASQSRG